MSLDDFIITCFCLIDEMVPSVTKHETIRATIVALVIFVNYLPQ